LDFAAAHANELRRLRADASRRTIALAAQGASLPARATMEKSRERDLVLVGGVRREKDPVTGLERLIDDDVSHPVEMPVFASFVGSDERPLPLAWAIRA